MLGSAERRKVRLIFREIIFEEFERMWSQSTIVTDGRTDGQTDNLPWQYRATRGKNGWTDLHEIFRGVEWPWDVLITFLVNSEKPRDAAMRNTGTGFVVLSPHSLFLVCITSLSDPFCCFHSRCPWPDGNLWHGYKTDGVVCDRWFVHFCRYYFLAFSPYVTLWKFYNI